MITHTNTYKHRGANTLEGLNWYRQPENIKRTNTVDKK